MEPLGKNKKFKKKNDHKKKINRLVCLYGGDILHSEIFLKTRGHIQHGTISVHQHSRDVAFYSLMICKKMNIKCDERSLVRGALLHDYFLYDWHIKDEKTIKRLHGVYHPLLAYKNAKKEYSINIIEEDIIKKHMWPLTIIPPVKREAWIVSFVDKYVSIIETAGVKKKYGSSL